MCAAVHSLQKSFLSLKGNSVANNRQVIAVAVETYIGPEGNRSLNLPGFLDRRHVNMTRLSALAAIAFSL
jgi:hypothetical protein